MGTRGLGTVLHLSFADQLVHAAVDVRVPAVSATLSTGGHVSLRGNVSKTVANPPHKKSPYEKGRSDIPPEERSTAAKRQRYGGNISPFIGCRQVFPSGPMGSRQSPPPGPMGSRKVSHRCPKVTWPKERPRHRAIPMCQPTRSHAGEQKIITGTVR